MFSNIGGKIKTLAVVIFGFGIAGSFFGAIGIGAMSESILAAILFFGTGFLLAWISVFFIYGFGELIERVTSIDDKLAPPMCVPPVAPPSAPQPMAPQPFAARPPVAPKPPTAPPVQPPASQAAKPGVYGDVVPVGVGKCAQCKWSDELWECVVQEGDHYTRKHLCNDCLKMYTPVTNG